MKSGLGRALAGVCVAAALAATAACGAGSADDAGKSADKSADKAAGKPAAKTEPKPLTKAELTQAALTKADAKGYRVGTTPDDEIPDVSVPADPASCQALADMTLVGTEPDAKARVSRSLTSLTATDATVLRVALLAHEESDAKKVVADLRTQSEKCASFEHAEVEYAKVAPLKAPAAGDEAVSYSLIGKVDGDTVPATYTVVRSGSTLAVFYGANLLSPKKALIPQKIIDAQIAKVEKQA
ncbi:hypothetical protein [Streptomyces sp. NPDC052225]|uniref:hypothetical protein n=1 Tax=Streptomyces sp. NPDC052225 TaxID=3154949 RepID=UPI00342B856B